MKRKLTKEEQEINEKQLNNHIKLVKELKDNLNYNEDLLKKQEYLREFDDEWRDYLRIRKDNEDNAVITQIKKEIENSEEHIKLLTKQLKEGVDVKNVTGV